jgi:hypothetical protein
LRLNLNKELMVYRKYLYQNNDNLTILARFWFRQALINWPKKDIYLTIISCSIEVKKSKRKWWDLRYFL